jgi:hypothetical protein
MRYWKGLLIAAAFDAAVIAGPDFFATEPPPPARSQAIQWPAGSASEPELPTLGELGGISRQVDSLMAYLQAHTADVSALETLARLYTSHGWWDDAVGPLARALALAPGDAQVAKHLAIALKRAGRDLATDAQLSQWAREFVEVVDMWGHGC